MGSTDSRQLSLFIPVYNADRYLPRVLDEAPRALAGCCDRFEIVIVDDCSRDGTVPSLETVERTLRPAHQAVRVIRNTVGPSRRENLAKAFVTARHEIVGFMDADLSCGTEYLVQALRRLHEERADVVIGSRYVKGATVTREPFRRVASFFYNLSIRLLFRSRILDHQCGLKVFRLARVRPIFAQMGYDHAFRRGWFWDAEFLVRAQKARLAIVEMPVVWHYTCTSTFQLLREWKCLGSILRLRLELWPRLARLLGGWFVRGGRQP